MGNCGAYKPTHNVSTTTRERFTARHSLLQVPQLIAPLGKDTYRVFYERHDD